MTAAVTVSEKSSGPVAGPSGMGQTGGRHKETEEKDKRDKLEFPIFFRHNVPQLEKGKVRVEVEFMFFLQKLLFSFFQPKQPGVGNTVAKTGGKKTGKSGGKKTNKTVSKTVGGSGDEYDDEFDFGFRQMKAAQGKTANKSDGNTGSKKRAKSGDDSDYDEFQRKDKV